MQSDVRIADSTVEYFLKAFVWYICDPKEMELP